jgi:hypothetical protein
MRKTDIASQFGHHIEQNFIAVHAQFDFVSNSGAFGAADGNVIRYATVCSAQPPNASGGRMLDRVPLRRHFQLW